MTNSEIPTTETSPTTTVGSRSLARGAVVIGLGLGMVFGNPAVGVVLGAGVATLIRGFSPRQVP